LGGAIGASGDLAGYFAAFATRIIRDKYLALTLEPVDIFSWRITAKAEFNGKTMGFGSCGDNLLTDFAFVHLLLAIEHSFEAANSRKSTDL
jgi:hypothetical protein